jgi:predicted DNA-binding ribbon-helix-helix protein
MSLIAQFKITLKDFVPDAADGMIIHDHGRGTSMTVSNRLYAQLRSYADDNQLQIGDIVAQLREEVHRC